MYTGAKRPEDGTFFNLRHKDDTLGPTDPRAAL